MKISFIGSGNVATHLALAFAKKNIQIEEIYSKNINNAEILTKQLKNTKATDSLDFSNSNAQLFFFCVRDSVLDEIILKIILPQDSIVVHTAGSISINIFNNKYKNCGVVYPLQTFSKNKVVDFSKTPFFIESNQKEIEDKLVDLINLLSNKIFILDSLERKKLHLAAVIACNFSNFLWSLSADVLSEKNIPFQVLEPLLQETLDKALLLNPQHSQTGPAVRRDMNVINEHIALLKSERDIQKIYKLLSQQIIDYYH